MKNRVRAKLTYLQIGETFDGHARMETAARTPMSPGYRSQPRAARGVHACVTIESITYLLVTDLNRRHKNEDECMKRSGYSGRMMPLEDWMTKGLANFAFTIFFSAFCNT